MPSNPRALALLSTITALLTGAVGARAQGAAAAPPSATHSAAEPAPAAPPGSAAPAAPAPTDTAPAPTDAAPPAPPRAPEAPPAGAAVSPYGAWNGSAPYGPPPVIALTPPPPPELEAPGYARRAVELLPELMLGFPQCDGGSLSSARCTGLRGGLGLGVGGLWRVSPYFAFGGTLSALGFGFRPPAQSALRDARAAGFFGGILGRVYFTDSGAFEPYLELALGGGALATTAVEADNRKYVESAAGGSLRVGGGLEFFVGPRLRLGPALDLTRFGSKQVRRCDAANQCVDLDAGAYGHGVGFFTLSCRLTILVGPKL